MRLFMLSTVMIAASLAAGCGVGYTATVSGRAYGPDLVYAAPGVQVIANYDEPIFYVDHFYWRFDGGTWYRSTYYTGGWAYAPPPVAISRIERPHEYVRYRPAGWVARRGPAQPGPVVREHRDAPPRYEPRQAEPSRPPAPRPVVAPPQAAPQPLPVPPRRAAPQPQQPPPGQGDHRDQQGGHGR
jgi:hypothetical protein